MIQLRNNLCSAKSVATLIGRLAPGRGAQTGRRGVLLTMGVSLLLQKAPQNTSAHVFEHRKNRVKRFCQMGVDPPDLATRPETTVTISGDRKRRLIDRGAGRALRERSGGWTITKAQDIGADICDFLRREDQVWHLRVRRCEEHPQGRRRHAASIGDIQEGWSDNNASWFLLLGLHHMTGIACFESESVSGGRVAILRMRAHGGQGQNCDGRESARDHWHDLSPWQARHSSQKRLAKAVHKVDELIGDANN
jgi:hypothetical protein